jgi:GNAT superfamily N-acetyltransferase
MLVIREATAADAPLIVEMIRELAEFERELDQVEITPEDIVRDGFGKNPSFHALIAEWHGKPAAYALYYFTFSTWSGSRGLFVEDLFVRAQFREKGIGKALLQRIAGVAREQNCHGMRWEVLNWNTPAIEFYRSLGAIMQEEWFPVLIMGPAFDNLASSRTSIKGSS